MDGLVTGKKRTYEEFRNHIPDNVKQLFDNIRNYSLSLGSNVVEDIRMHRIVFSKSMSFRNFADVEPQREYLIIKIRKDRKVPDREIQIKPTDSLEEIRKLLLEAYTSIH